MKTHPSNNRKLINIIKNFFSPLLPWQVQDAVFYYRSFGKLPSIKKPRTFSEKVLHRKHYASKDIYTKLADKFLVRDYVKEKIGDEYLIPLLFNSNNPAELLSFPDWKNIVIKPNHGAGMVEIIDNIDISEARKKEIVEKCKNWLKIDFSKAAREIHYRKIPKLILVEKKLGEGTLNDYKFHCFKTKNNEYKYVLQVVNDRFSETDSRGYYLNSLEDCVWSHGMGNHSIPTAEKPLLHKAVELNSKLAQDFDYLRIDWYAHDGQLYFGELTFTPGAGLINEFGPELEKKMGDMWEVF